MKPSLNLIRNKKKKLLKKFLDDQIFQKSQFSIYALHRIKFLMDFIELGAFQKPSERFPLWRVVVMQK